MRAAVSARPPARFRVGSARITSPRAGEVTVVIGIGDIETAAERIAGCRSR